MYIQFKSIPSNSLTAYILYTRYISYILYSDAGKCYAGVCMRLASNSSTSLSPTLCCCASCRPVAAGRTEEGAVPMAAVRFSPASSITWFTSSSASVSTSSPSKSSISSPHISSDTFIFSISRAYDCIVCCICCGPPVTWFIAPIAWPATPIVSIAMADDTICVFCDLMDVRRLLVCCICSRDLRIRAICFARLLTSASRPLLWACFSFEVASFSCRSRSLISLSMSRLPRSRDLLVSFAVFLISFLRSVASGFLPKKFITRIFHS
mmetsp:Transcript_14962/g.24762  ORF Transcript_14962/g.24762 Transcript_14962/m.24762 type:complete len:266 (+) Transcript_14962:68-865(+)